MHYRYIGHSWSKKRYIDWTQYKVVGECTKGKYFSGSQVTDYKHLASISSSVSPLVSGIMKYMNTSDPTAIAQNT